ncbi:hypothetical protein ANN_21954 [Periplaneta americana]|uniref:Uncharacterized protein n=1 Tax=Periplaneta americana TaxID=6978 RepID=A0ABQ8S7N4_PERAM|nr:hypothetical protein ANN_21954 [Periplaneta americana]
MLCDESECVQNRELQNNVYNQFRFYRLKNIRQGRPSDRIFDFQPVITYDLQARQNTRRTSSYMKPTFSEYTKRVTKLKDIYFVLLKNVWGRTRKKPNQVFSASWNRSRAPERNSGSARKFFSRLTYVGGYIIIIIIIIIIITIINIIIIILSDNQFRAEYVSIIRSIIATVLKIMTSSFRSGLADGSHKRIDVTVFENKSKVHIIDPTIGFVGCQPQCIFYSFFSLPPLFITPPFYLKRHLQSQPTDDDDGRCVSDRQEQRQNPSEEDKVEEDWQL